MKTAQIQLQITSIKQMAREWATTQTQQDWTEFCNGINDLVRLVVEELPTKEVIKEVPVTHDVAVNKEITKPVEVIREVPIYLPEPGPTPNLAGGPPVPHR